MNFIVHSLLERFALITNLYFSHRVRSHRGQVVQISMPSTCILSSNSSQYGEAIQLVRRQQPFNKPREQIVVTSQSLSRKRPSPMHDMIQTLCVSQGQPIHTERKPHTLESGRVVSEMGRVDRYGQMERSMRATGRTIELMDMENSLTQMVMFTKVTGSMIKLMDMESMSI